MITTLPSPSDEMQAVAPVARSSRIAAIDVLRGFALLGILLGNLQDFASPASILHDIPLEALQPGHWADKALMGFDWLFMEGKMRALFGLLFGAGTVLLLERITERHGAEMAADIFHRRNMWLLLFGLIHGLFIFAGDILFYYATISLLALYPLRKVAPRRLLTVGLALSLAGGTLGIFNAFDGASALPSAALQESAYRAMQQGRMPTAEERKAVADAQHARAQKIASLPQAAAAGRGGYARTEPDNLRGEIGFVETIFTSGWIFEVAGIMIAGMGLFKTGFFSAQLPAATYLRVVLVGYTLAFSVVLLGFYQADRFGFSDEIALKWIFLPYGIQQIAGMLANASLILWLVKTGRLRGIQRCLAAVGQMALTNYILQSLICRTLFSWGPWPLYGTMPFHTQAYVGAAIWSVNIIGSLLWLRVYRFGPLEWLWRSLTYWRLQPMRLHHS